jgi:hypothetical protein
MAVDVYLEGYYTQRGEKDIYLFSMRPDHMEVVSWDKDGNQYEVREFDGGDKQVFRAYINGAWKNADF